MARLFDRRVKVTIGKEPASNNLVELMPVAHVFTGLRVQFRIEKSLRPEPQKAQVAVWNLSQDSRSALVGKGLRVVLEAGYPDTIAQIYSGHTRTCDHPKLPTEWVSKFECGTGERAIQFARVSESFNPGASVGDIIKKVAATMVTDPGNTLKKADELTQTFASSYATHGFAAPELSRLLEPLGYSWSIQDDVMQILGPTDSTTDEPVVLSESTGLIGTPELGSPPTKGKPSLLKVKSLLQPQFAPGKRILLNSKSRSGTFKIITCTHLGDTAGAEWYSELECVPS